MRVDRLHERVGRVGEQQVRLVEEEDELGLVEVARLRELLEQLGDEPHHHRREQPGLVLDGRQLEAGDHAAAVRPDPHQVGDVELRLAEELGPAAGLQRRRASAAGRRRSPARARRCPPAPPCRPWSPGTSAARAGRRGRAAAGPWCRRSGRRARARTPASRWRRAPSPAAAGPKSETVARTGTPGPMPPSERNSTGKPVGANGSPRSFIRASAGPPASPGSARPGQVALDVGHEDGHALGGELLRDQLQRLRLARAGRAGDQPVAVHRRQRQPHDRLGRQRALVDAAAEVDRPRPRSRTPARSSRRSPPSDAHRTAQDLLHDLVGAAADRARGGSRAPRARAPGRGRAARAAGRAGRTTRAGWRAWPS